MENKKVNKIVGQFPMYILKKSVYILEIIKKHNISIDNLKEYIEYIEQLRNKKGKLSLFKNKKCPECKDFLFLYRITIPKGKNNVNGYKSKWFCKVCLYEEFLLKSIDEIISELT